MHAGAGTDLRIVSQTEVTASSHTQYRPSIGATTGSGIQAIFTNCGTGPGPGANWTNMSPSVSIDACTISQSGVYAALAANKAQYVAASTGVNFKSIAVNAAESPDTGMSNRS
jgi:hypothetical protein